MEEIKMVAVSLTAPAMSTQGTMQIVHRTKATRVPRRGEHEPAVSVSAKSPLPKPSYGRRRDTR